MNHRTTMLVIGLHNNSCRERLIAALESVPGVAQVDVSLYRARAVIVHSSDCESETLVRAIEDAGFEARALPPERTPVARGDMRA